MDTVYLDFKVFDRSTSSKGYNKDGKGYFEEHGMRKVVNG